MMSVIHVAVAIIQNNNSQLLIQQRAKDSHQGGLWEFPGGKREVNETVEQALVREVKEELGIDVLACRPLMRVNHQYDDRSVLLDVHWVTQWSGQVQSMEGQPIKWVAFDDLSQYRLPAADKPILMAIQLPVSFVITPSKIIDPASLLRQLDRLLAQGEKLFLYRVKHLVNGTHDQFIQQMIKKCHVSNAKLMLHEKNSSQALLSQVDGLHLTEEGLSQYVSRPETLKNKLLSVSCHSLKTLRQAESIKADFALLSPVEATQSHPDIRPIGWTFFAEQVDKVNLPIYALGGMTMDKINQAHSFGAQGVAGISSWWG